jgi:UDP-glucose 4-epimerase
MAKCLVLGANGFIGSHLVDALVKAGHEVRAFDRFGDYRPRFDEDPKIKLFKGDFLNRDDLERAVKDMDYVFHFISTTTPATAENDPLIDVDTNIKMSINLFEECANQQVKKVIFASTGGAIYGSTTGEPIPETTLPQPVSPYAIGKLTIEHYLRYFKAKFGLDSTVFRISNPYGERHALQAKQGVINIFLEHIAANQPITILGDGGMVRDYIYVTDVARMIAASFEAAKEQVYNLGSGHGLTLNELVTVIERVTGQPVQKNHQEKPATFINKVVLNTDRFQSEFPGRPAVDMEEGIKRTWEYVLEAGES